MKLFRVSLLMLSAILLYSCIAEDISDCPVVGRNNLILNFDYKDEKGVDLFSDNIHQVEVFVYDTNGRFVQRKTVAKQALSAFAGTELSLSPGSYRLVCWGNAFDKTSLPTLATGDSFNAASLDFGILDANSIAKGGDPLYYAPYSQRLSPPSSFTVNVPETGVQTATISFCSAHVRIEVYVKGFESKPTGPGSTFPLVELTNIPAKYDFNLQTSANVISYRDVTVARVVAGEQYAAINFHTPLFYEDTPIQVLIREQSTLNTVTTVTLKDFIRDNNITLGGRSETVIPILIEYKSVGVSISLPGWGQNPVGPEL